MKNTRQHELVVLGGVWTYGHPAFSEDGRKTFISGAAEGKEEVTNVAYFLREAEAVYLPRSINHWELNVASGVNSCSVVQPLMTVVFTHQISSFQSCLANSARAIFFPHSENLKHPIFYHYHFISSLFYKETACFISSDV